MRRETSVSKIRCQQQSISSADRGIVQVAVSPPLDYSGIRHGNLIFEVQIHEKLVAKNSAERVKPRPRMTLLALKTTPLKKFMRVTLLHSSKMERPQ